MPLSGVCFLSEITIYFSRHQQFALTLIRNKALNFRKGGGVVVAAFIVHAFFDNISLLLLLLLFLLFLLLLSIQFK